MVRSRKRKSPSPAYRRRTPLVLGWLLGLLLAAAMLVWLAYLVGRKSVPAKPGKETDAILGGASSPGIAVGIAFGALILAAWCSRNLILHWLAWRPGRIDVAPFTAATKLKSADPEALTISFRRQLATLRLQAPTPVPGAAPEGDFLDVLGSGTTESGNILATLLNLLRAGVPDHAYEVHGVLSEHSERPRCRITVQVLERPSQSTLPIRVHGDSWDAVLSEAADEATAAILPRTRQCRAPWASWRRRVMPRGLLHAYEEATRLEQDRRYDEALQRYYEAADLDPMNIVLRLRIGHLQERMGLFLDALATYWGSEATSRPAGSRLPLFLYRGAARRQRRRARLSARYRRIVLLGGRVLAEQWRTPPESEERLRDARRADVRACLRPHLQHELEQLPKTGSELFHKDVLSEKIKYALSEERLSSYPSQDEDPRFRELRDLFARYAVKEARRLAWQLRFRFFDRRSTLTPITVSLTAECIGVRQAWLANLLDDVRRWPMPPEVVRGRIWAIERIGWRRSFRLWHEHYNAACAYALALNDAEGVSADVRKRLARMAVCRLQKATTRADSGYIASRRDWLVSEDPDLKGLRATPEFANFEVMYLPAAQDTPRRPHNVQQLESSRYVKALLVATAQRWQTAWHRRARELGSAPDIREVLDWFTHELQMWNHVRAVARDYRHSGTRLELIQAVGSCAAGYGLSPLAVAFPRYEDEPLPVEGHSCERAAQEEVTEANARLRALWCELRANEPEEPATKLLDDLARWQATLRLFDAASRAPSRYFLAQLCDLHAAMWQLMEQWLIAPYGSEPAAASRFRAKVTQTRRAWYAALAGWLPFAEALAAVGEQSDPNGLTRVEVLRYQMLARLSQVRFATGARMVPQRENGSVAPRVEETAAS